MLEITEKNFENEVLKSNVPVLIDFWAPWCGPCQKMGPVIEELSSDLAGQPVKIGKLNIDKNGVIAEKYGILSIPTFFVFKDGQITGQITGVVSKEKLKSALGL